MELSDFLTYVRRDFKRTDKDQEITDAYNAMIIWVASIIPHGNYKYQSYLTTVVGQEDYPLPSNLMHLIHPIRLLLGSGSSDSGFQLEHLTKEEYDRRQSNPNRSSPSTGRPGIYCIYSRSILLDSIPDLATYILEINWSKRPTTLSADSDTPALGSEWDEVLKWGVLERSYAGLGMLQEANYWASLYRDQAGNPIGLCKRLVDAEKDREMSAIGQVQNNCL